MKIAQIKDVEELNTAFADPSMEVFRLADVSLAPSVVRCLETLGAIVLQVEGNSDLEGLINVARNGHPGSRVVIVQTLAGTVAATHVPRHDVDMSPGPAAEAAGDLGPPLSRNVYEVSQVVTPLGVDLRHNVVWRTPLAEPGDGFVHTEKVGEQFLFKYPLKVHFSCNGSWDARTPILHPAVGGMDVTAAGFDEAYIRALSNVGIILRGRQEDFTIWARQLITRYIKKKLHPFRLLVRGAALWTGAIIKELQGETLCSWSNVGQRSSPTMIRNTDTFAAFARDQLDAPSDVLYIRCESGDELHMVDVMQALASDVYPIDAEAAVSALWPNLNNPRVVYSSTDFLARPGGAFSAMEVYDTMVRYCDIHDCHDLWEQALQYVQAFVARPLQGAVLGGCFRIGSALPESNLLAGALGPLMSNVSAEGMRTLPIQQPNPKEYLYGGAVRGCYLSAAYFEALRARQDSHPVRVSVGTSNYSHFRALLSARYARQFNGQEVAPKAATMGWDCLNEPLKWLAPLISQKTLPRLLDANKVAWWTCVLPHLPARGGTYLETWFKPSIPDMIPNSGRWYACRIVGVTTDEQVAAALRWFGVSVRYIIERSNGTISTIHLSPASAGRFLPTLKPYLSMGSDVARASIKFPPGVAQRMELVRRLCRCEISLQYDYDTEWGIPVEDFDYGPPMSMQFSHPPPIEPPGHTGSRSPPRATVERESEPNEPEDYIVGMTSALQDLMSRYPQLAAIDLTAMGARAAAPSDRYAEHERIGIMRSLNLVAQEIGRTDNPTTQIVNDLRTIASAMGHASRGVVAGVNKVYLLENIPWIKSRALQLERDIQNQETINRAARAMETLANRRQRDEQERLEQALQWAADFPSTSQAADDPEAETQTPQDFGPPTSDQGLVSLPPAAADVGETPAVAVQAEEGPVGFLPPPSSSD